MLKGRKPYIYRQRGVGGCSGKLEKVIVVINWLDPLGTGRFHGEVIFHWLTTKCNLRVVILVVLMQQPRVLESSALQNLSQGRKMTHLLTLSHLKVMGFSVPKSILIIEIHEGRQIAVLHMFWIFGTINPSHIYISCRLSIVWVVSCFSYCRSFPFIQP
jgi:hypothetical protein